ncbi:transposase [Puniceicoccus vermicola]|uniref:Transposase n=1 Tax=Puniceicoccus vermicola TaxID=388746 RepID=A0A7X1AZU4_9BACT|nr:transposase [Puniceicoccus vermicola]MBC2601905.1 transposase [Puniceicoccus vermicola]
MSRSISRDSAPFDWSTRFLGIYQDDLPHWVVEHGRYSVTLRCAGSLPSTTILQLEEQKRFLQTVEPKSPEAEKARRKVFLCLDEYLDRGWGFTPFSRLEVSKAFDVWLRKYKGDQLELSDFVIMPNHIHLLTRPIHLHSIEEFKRIWMRFKGRSARFLNQYLNRSGKFWQTYGYDRWIRNATEYQSWQKYLAQNPVKANLCRKSEDYPFLHLET